MFTGALFTIAKIWKQPKCPSVGEWIKKLRYIYTMGYYSIVEKIFPVVTAGMDLEIIMLSEISQSEKHEYHLISRVEPNEQNKLTNKIETEAWTRETHWQAARGECGEGTGWKKGKGLSKKSYMHDRHRQPVVTARGKGGEGTWR